MAQTVAEMMFDQDMPKFFKKDAPAATFPTFLREAGQKESWRRKVHLTLRALMISQPQHCAQL